MIQKVVITHWVHREVIDYLKPHCELVLNESRGTFSRQELLKRTKDAAGVMVFMPDRIDDSFLAACPKLKIVAGALKGYDNFDVSSCEKRGIWFTITPNLLTNPTADLTICLLIGISRNVLPGDGLVRSENFRGWRPHFYGAGITGAAIGIIGMGAVGRAVAKRLKGFDAKVIYYDTTPLSEDMERELKVSRASLEEVLSGSQFLIPMLPLTKETKHLIGEEVIAKMRRGSYLINTSRGSVVDERAVAAALKNGHLAGYAADVFEFEDWALPEKPQSIPQELLENQDQTLFTPHLGSAVDEIRLAITMEAARNIVQAFNGESPQGAVNEPAAPQGTAYIAADAL